MAGGPLYPSELKIEDSPNIFGDVFIGDGTNGHEVNVISVIADLGADVKMMLEYELPVEIPSGTAKLKMTALAHRTSLVAKHNPAWNMSDDEEDSSELTLTAEGVETTTWASGDDGVNKITKTILDAFGLVGGKTLVMHIKFPTSGWTQDVNVSWKRPTIIWE